MSEAIMTSAGLVKESDYLSLSFDIKLSGLIIIDKANGAKHVMTPAARLILNKIEKGTYVSDLTNYCARRKINRHEMYGVLKFLNDIAALKISRSIVSELSLNFKRIYIYAHGVAPVKKIYRYQSNAKGLFRATSNSLLKICLATLAVHQLVISAGIQINNLNVYEATFIFIIYISTVSHEYSHLILAKKSGKSAIIRSGMRLGVIFAGNRRTKIKSAIVGPVIGASISGLLGIIAGTIDNDTTIIYIGALVAGFHILSWMPSYGDGSIIFGRNK